MKKMMFVLLGLAAVFAIVIAFPGVRDELHWRWVSHNDQPKDYAAYFKLWPDGRHAAEAKAIWDERSWADAKAANTSKDYAAYLEMWPDGRHAAEAKAAWDERSWADAKAANTSKDYAAYLELRPDGRHAAEAKAIWHERSWTDAKVANTFHGFSIYLRDHPEGKYVSQARERAGSLRWVNNGDDTVTDYKTGLTWQLKESGKKMTLSEAATYCGELKLARHFDWRLPSIEELKSLITAETENPVFNKSVFPKRKSEQYWSSDFRDVMGISTTGVLDMSNGKISWLGNPEELTRPFRVLGVNIPLPPPRRHYVWPVRGGEK